MSVLVVLMLGFAGSFLHARRVTEASVLHAAASSLVYGLVEQPKGVGCLELLPSRNVDDNAPAARTRGLHEGFAAAGHHVPLEPIVLNSRRMRYKELAASEYAAWKTTIEALPNP